ncbi:MAG: hypothetical protein ABIJ92_03335 [Candidatus Aenigmatarchaeota archaeon]
MPETKKLKIGIFSFTGDEGCVITLIEVLNDYFFKWKDYLDIKYARVLQKNNTLEDIDVSIIEGAISSKREEKKIKEIRKNSKRIIAFGSCAISGTPSNHRNFFDKEKLEEIDFIVKRFKLNKKVEPLNKFIKVDVEVPGCPIIEKIFIDQMYKYFEEFGIKVPR